MNAATALRDGAGTSWPRPEKTSPIAILEILSVLSSSAETTNFLAPRTEGSTVSATESPQGDQSDRNPASIDAVIAINARSFTAWENFEAALPLEI